MMTNEASEQAKRDREAKQAEQAKAEASTTEQAEAELAEAVAEAVTEDSRSQ